MWENPSLIGNFMVSISMRDKEIASGGNGIKIPDWIV